MAPVCCGNMRSCRALKIQRTSVRRGQPFGWTSFYSYCVLVGVFRMLFPVEASGFRSSSFRVVGHDAVGAAYPEDA